MGLLIAVATGVPGDQQTKIALQGVHCGRPHAAAGREAAHQHAINALRDQQLTQRTVEERARHGLANYEVLGLGPNRRCDLGHRRAGDEQVQQRDLLAEDAGLGRVAVGIDGVGNRQGSFSKGGEQPRDDSKLPRALAPQRRGRVGEADGCVDDDQGGPFAEADPCAGQCCHLTSLQA